MFDTSASLRTIVASAGFSHPVDRSLTRFGEDDGSVGVCGYVCVSTGVKNTDLLVCFVSENSSRVAIRLLYTSILAELINPEVIKDVATTALISFFFCFF